MPFIKFYFPPALLLLFFTCAGWQVGQSWPIATTDSCAVLAHSLLGNITETLDKKHLFSGIDCSKQNVELYVNSSTPSVCAPKGFSCSGTIASNHNRESCEREIVKDLDLFYQFLITQPDPDNVLTRSILLSLTDLMNNCPSLTHKSERKNFLSLATESDQVKAAADRSNTYDERLTLCKVLKGFHVRAITINRAISYMTSGQ